MKSLSIAFLLIIGFCLAQSNSESDEIAEIDSSETKLGSSIELSPKRKVLKRIVRDTFSNMGDSFLMQFESAVISNCKLNGHQQTADTLQDTYNEMKTCLSKKKIIVTPKNEFIAHIEECSKDSIRKTKSCLADNQKYFPEFVLDVFKSVTNFMYDDINYIRVDLTACLPRFNRYSVQRSYIQCLTDAAIQTGDSSQIPTSKASTCQKFIPVTYCFTNMIRDTCDRSSNLDKFREDYINAMKAPCDKKE